MADQPALLPDAAPPGTHRPGGTSSLQRLFRAHFSEVVARDDTELTKRPGKSGPKRPSGEPCGSLLRCGRYGSSMKLIAVITEPQQVRSIHLHLVNTGAAPPGLDPASLN